MEPISCVLLSTHDSNVRRGSAEAGAQARREQVSYSGECRHREQGLVEGGVAEGVAKGGMAQTGAAAWWPFFAGCSFVPVVLAIGFASAGAGHGNYVLARLLLPFACMDLGRPGNPWIIVPLALVQWPAYGLAVSLPRRLRSRWIAAGIVATLHLIGVILMFTILSEGFRR